MTHLGVAVQCGDVQDELENEKGALAPVKVAAGFEVSEFLTSASIEL
jgi:hypothetical protein